MKTETIILCRAGTKWTAPLSTSTPDPCPNGQKMTAETISFTTEADITQPQQINFNAAENKAAFGFAFTSILFCWLTAKGIGLLINFWKNN